MTGFRTKRPTRAAILALAALLAAAPAAAQSGDVGEPVRLAPQDDGDADRDAGAESGATGQAGEGIEVDRLGEYDAGTIGVLDPGKGGFAATMWEGTPRHLVEAVLPRLPGDLRTPVLRDLARRLLLSSVAPPVRRQPASNESPSLLQLRLARLQALGDLNGLGELLQVIPRRFDDARIARLRVEMLLLSQETRAACQEVRNAIQDYDAGFWQKAMATCQLAAGETDQANLTIGLLREQGAADDATFLRLFDAVERGAKTTPEIDRLTPLALAVLSIGGLPVPDSALDGADLATLLAVTRHASSSTAVRAKAGEEAARRGALSSARLGALYARFEFADKRLTNVARVNGDSAEQMSGLDRRALLYQAARQEPADPVRAELARQALESADAGLRVAIARLFAPIVAEIKPRPELAWFAEHAGRTLYADKRYEAAGAWLTLAREEAILTPEAAAAVTALWPYARLAGETEVPVNGGLAAWRSAQGGVPEAAMQYRQALLRASFQALGQREDRAWMEIVAEGAASGRTVPPAAVLYALRDASREGRLGETVLLSLIALGGGGVEGCHALVFGSVLEALSEVGLKPEARRLAIEAAVANGI